MSKELDEFMNALLVRNVLARTFEGKAFPSQKALQDYLKKHPNADKSKHTVDDPDVARIRKDNDDYKKLQRGQQNAEKAKARRKEEKGKKEDADHADKLKKNLEKHNQDFPEGSVRKSPKKQDAWKDETDGEREERLKKRKTATDFSSPEALRTYLREHPNADKSKHHVKSEGHGKAHKALDDLEKDHPDFDKDEIKAWRKEIENAAGDEKKLQKLHREIEENSGIQRGYKRREKGTDKAHKALDRLEENHPDFDKDDLKGWRKEIDEAAGDSKKLDKLLRDINTEDETQKGYKRKGK